EVMGRVLPGAGELGTGRLGCGGCGACVRPGAPRTRSAQADDTARLAELPLDALERELPRLRDPHVVPDDGEDVDRGEEGVGEHRPSPDIITGKRKVTSMFVIHRIITANPLAAPRTALGKISASITHITGPGPACMPSMNSTITTTTR